MTHTVLLQTEWARLKRKGWWLLLGYSFLFWLSVVHLELLRPLYASLPVEGYPLCTAILNTAVQFFSLAIPTAVWQLLYRLKLPFFEQYRVDTKPWPWERGSDAETQRKIMRTVVYTYAVLIPVSSLLTAYGPVYTELRPSEFPSLTAHCVNLCLFIAVEDTWFYWLHRMLHLPYFYKRVHRIHHEYVELNSLATHYAHLFEIAVNGMGATFLVVMIRGQALHIATLWVWAMMKTIETVNDHAGYDIPWCPFRVLPFTGGAAYHEVHHRRNRGNFTSFFVLWDFVCGTHDGYSINKKH